MKFVYTLVSTENDFYYEQLVCSVYTLKKYNVDAHTILVVDDKTASTLIEKRKKIYKYFSEVKVISIPKLDEDIRVSRYLKTNIKHFINGDFIYLDVDTIICDSLQEIESMDIDIGAVIDYHMNYPDYIGQKKERLALNIPLDIKYYNSGMLVCKDTKATQNIMDAWYNLYKKHDKLGKPYDQLSLNMINHELGGVISELPGEWNCMITHGVKYLSNSKIIHYCPTRDDNPYIPATTKFLKLIKEEGDITEYCKKILNNPRNAFTDTNLYNHESSISKTVELKSFLVLHKMYVRNSIFLIGLEKILNIIYKKIPSNKYKKLQ